jgi:hypothetical protein
MIGGLLRFAPGRLGARKGRAPWSCGSRRWAAYWLPWRVLGDELGTRGPARCCGSRMLSEAGMATGGATWARCVSRGWLEEVGGLLVGKTWAPGGCRAARLRVLPCPSPSRSFARYAAPSASLTASLWHGIGRWRAGRSLPLAHAAQPSSSLALGPIWDHAPSAQANKPHVTEPSAARENRLDLQIGLLPRPGGQGVAGSDPAVPTGSRLAATRTWLAGSQTGSQAS